MLRLVLTLTALLFVMPVSGSLIEDLGVAYQFDGGTHHDAPDACQDADPYWQLRPNNSTHGMLVPIDDESDHYVFNTSADDIGKRYEISLQETSTHAADIKASLDVLNADCTSIFDVMAAPMAAPGHKTVESVRLEGDNKCTDHWYFIINGVTHDTAPDTIRVTWTDGSSKDIPMIEPQIPSDPVGHYKTSEHTDVTIHKAWAVVPEAWNSQFNLGKRACGAVDGGYQEPTLLSSGLEFSVVGSGQYVIAVHLERVEPADPTGPIVVPVNCHFMCVPGLETLAEEISYLLKADKQADGQDV